jgi:hypothetical protein
MDLLVGILGIFLFRYNNPRRKYVNSISGFILTLFSGQIIIDYNILPHQLDQIIWISSVIGLLIFYLLRFISKENKEFIDYLKLFALVLLIIYTAPFYEIYSSNNHSASALHHSTFIIILLIYIYDRWILKTMNRKFVITLVAQSVAILLLLIYAFFQKSIADEQTRLAQLNQTIAQENEKRCIERVNALENKLKGNF